MSTMIITIKKLIELFSALHDSQQLPSIPRVKHLTVQDNGVSTLDGLSNLRSSPLEELYLAGNPVAFKIGYRYMYGT